MNDRDISSQGVYAEGPEGLTAELDKLFVESQKNNPQFNSAEHYIIYQFQGRTSLIKVDTTEPLFQFWFCNLDRLPVIAPEIKPIREFIETRLLQNLKSLELLSSDADIPQWIDAGMHNLFRDMYDLHWRKEKIDAMSRGVSPVHVAMSIPEAHDVLSLEKRHELAPVAAATLAPASAPAPAPAPARRPWYGLFAGSASAPAAPSKQNAVTPDSKRDEQHKP